MITQTSHTYNSEEGHCSSFAEGKTSSWPFNEAGDINSPPVSKLPPPLIEVGDILYSLYFEFLLVFSRFYFMFYVFDLHFSCRDLQLCANSKGLYQQ